MSAVENPVQPTAAQTNAPVPIAASAPTSTSSPKDEVQNCQWGTCTEKCQSAEQLYDHICERHVGRKSTNNLNLTCAWGTCRTTTVKRDHITSHIRVHVPLKPHKCDFCGKSFKRPQDLKKHVKTHADDSVLLRSPDPVRAERATAGSYYDGAGMPANGHSYGAPIGSSVMSAGYYGTAAPQQQPASYGSVYYGSGTAGEITQAAVLENRKRGIDALNDFLADVKRRQFDPASYAEVGHRLLQLQSLGMPVQGVSDYQHPAPLLGSGAHQTSAAGAHHTGPVPQYQYSLPRLPDLRTKSDLVNIDQFLEQMQTTVYENSTQAAAAGYPQSGITLPHAGNGFRASNSPPQLHSSTTTSGAPAAPIMASTPSASGTPALTPPSSGMSSTSGYSPISLPSVHGASPDPQTMGGLYPSLPALSSAADMHSTFGASAAPSSGLGSAFDVDARRRFPGGRLQQSVQVKDKMDLVEEEEKDGASTPKPSSSESRKSPEGDDESYDDWIGNIRVIEGLRGMIAIALEHKEYDDENKDIAHEDEAKEVEISYPVIGSEAAI